MHRQRAFASLCGRQGVVVVVFLLLVACGGGKKGILSEKAMEDVLFDYHLAESMLRQQSADTAQQRLYLDAVFAKHHTTRAVFDSSMVYYATHADRLYGIYEHLAERLTNLGRLQGIDNSNLLGAYSAEGDTANLWNGDRAVLLTPYMPHNMLKYAIAADSTVHRGDKFILSFRTDFLFQEGVRNGYAMFSLRLRNDSVITRTKLLSQNSTHTLEIADVERRGVKEIRGFFVLRDLNAASPTAAAPLRLLFLSDIQLIRMHTPTPADFVEEEALLSAGDTLSAAADTTNIHLRDSMKNDNNETTIKPTPVTALGGRQ